MDLTTLEKRLYLAGESIADREFKKILDCQDKIISLRHQLMLLTLQLDGEISRLESAIDSYSIVRTEIERISKSN